MNHTTVRCVGIDVAKAKLDVACVRDDRTTVHQIFINTTPGIASLAKFLKQQRTASTVPCVLKSTGDYHLLSGLMLTKAGFSVKCINPLITKKYCRASLRDAKSDKIDAARLAEIGMIEPNVPAFVDTRESIAAKKILSALAHLERTRQELAGHLQLLKETCKALGIQVQHRDTKRALACIERQIELYRAQMRALAPKEAQELSDRLRGVSHNQVATLLIALGDKQFENRDQLVAFVGLDVRLRQSGTWRGKQALSKRGSEYLRKVLFQIGWGLMMHDERYRSLYQTMRARGKNYKTRIIACARKFLRLLFAFYWKKTVAFPEAAAATTFESVAVLTSPALCSV